LKRVEPNIGERHAMNIAAIECANEHMFLHIT